MKKLRFEKLIVEKYKSGPRQDELKPFELPDDATIVHVYPGVERAIVYYTVPARG